MSDDRPDVLVIGGGVAGVCTAHFLVERGARVTLLERDEICSGASYGNAGWIFPSHSMPLPGPGVIRKSFRWLVDPESPLYIKPRLDGALVRWLWDFRAACTHERMRRTFRLNRDLSLASQALYEKLAVIPGLDFGYQRRGLMVVCRTREAVDEAALEIELLRAYGGEGRVLGRAEVRDLASCVTDEIAGGAYLPGDAHLDPAAFVRGLAAEVARRGARILPHTEVMCLELSGGRVSRVVATRGDYACDHVVLAGGAWSPAIASALPLRLPIQGAKGYSITLRRPAEMGDIPLMLSEAKVGVTPLGDTVRFAGTLELAGLDLSINQRRVAAIERAVRTYLPGLGESERIETWRGLRPCTPDDLPVIGRSRRVKNLWLATGHGMKGIAQGPITGEIVAQVLSGELPSMQLAPFSPDRF